MHDQPATTQDETHAHYNPDPHAHPGLHVIAVFEAAGPAGMDRRERPGADRAQPLQHWVHLLIARFQLDPDRGAMSWLANAIGPGTVAPGRGDRRGLRRAAHRRRLGPVAGEGLGLVARLRHRRAVPALRHLCLRATATGWEAVVVAVNLLVVWVLARDLLKRKR